VSPVPAGWEQAHEDAQIAQTVPLFAATDRQYEKMTFDFCRDKIDSKCMWLWRKTGIDWTNVNQVTSDGIAFAFLHWRPRNGNGTPTEHRFTLCLFLGTNQTNANAILTDLEITVKAFADEQVARNRFYLVKEINGNYPQRVEDVITAILRRLTRKLGFPAEYGWPARHVWKIVDWT
jgi:hypothetical protein